MRGSSEITPLRDLENHCEPERAIPREVFELQGWLNRGINMAMENLLSLQEIKAKEIDYLADVREAIYNLDLVRVTR